MFKDNLFNRIEKKTNVNKETILNLADKLKGDNMKDEKTIREVIQELCKITGKDISKEKEDKIISTIINDQVPQNVEKMFWKDYKFSLFYYIIILE